MDRIEKSKKESFIHELYQEKGYQTILGEDLKIINLQKRSGMDNMVSYIKQSTLNQERYLHVSAWK